MVVYQNVRTLNTKYHLCGVELIEGLTIIVETKSYKVYHCKIINGMIRTRSYGKYSKTIPKSEVICATPDDTNWKYV